MNKIYLNPEEIKRLAPSVLRQADKGPQTGASDHYTFFTTVDVIDMFQKKGWGIIGVGQQNSKKNPETVKHVVHFHNKKFSEQLGCEVQISLVNSHDRSSKLRFVITVSNNITGNRIYTLNECEVRHMGHDYDLVKNNLKYLTDEIPNAYLQLEKFRAFNLGKEAMDEFAVRAIAIRYPEFIKPNGTIDEKKLRKATDISKFIELDEKFVTKNKLNMFDAFNFIHNRIIHGKTWSLKLNDDKPRVVRDASKDVRVTKNISQALWNLALELTTK